jgi:endonuclease-8
MVEGPLAHHYARQIRRVLKGKAVNVKFGVPELKRHERSLRKVLVKDVEVHGKQFRIKLAGGRVILVHLMLFGAWRVYKRGEAWEKPRRMARLILRTASHDVIAFSAPLVKVLTEEEIGPDSKWGQLGPDPLRKDFSSREFFRRLKAKASREVGEVLLDQKVISGVGNIIRIEALFRAGIHPNRRVSDLRRNDRQRLLRWLVKFMWKWLEERDSEKKWIRVYEGNGKPCPRCGGEVEAFRQGGRITYACPDCQS